MREIKRIHSPDLHAAIEAILEKITRRHTDTKNLVVVGIANGGISLSQRLAKRLTGMLGREVAAGVVNIAFHRDDIRHNPIPKVTNPTQLPLNIEGSAVILADDVIFSGRSARAAMNEVFDQGRPERVELAVLCDRGHRKLPIQADYLGFTEETTPTQKVVVNIDNSNPDSDTMAIFQE